MGTASDFQWAWSAVSRAAAIEKRDPVVHEGTACRQGLPAGADMGVRGFVVAEVLAREGPVFSLGLVDDRDVRRDPLLLDQPVQHRGRSIGGNRRRAAAV